MERPTSVTVFGILNILFSLLGLCGTAMTVLMFLAPGGGINLQANPFLRWQDNPLMDAWLKGSIVMGLIAGVALFISGVGLLYLRPWARKLSIGYALYGILATVVGGALTTWFVTLPMIDQFRGQGGPEAAGAIGGAIGGSAGSCIGLIHPVLLWYYMTRPHVVAAFAGTWASPEAAPESLTSPFAQPLPLPESNNPYASPAPVATRVVAGADRPASGVESVVESLIPSKNGPALAAYYLGLFSLFPCLGFPLGVAAVYYGVRGLRKERENPAVRGGLHAWVGVICGSLFGLFNFLLLAALIVGIIAAAVGK